MSLRLKDVRFKMSNLSLILQQIGLFEENCCDLDTKAQFLGIKILIFERKIGDISQTPPIYGIYYDMDCSFDYQLH